MIKAILFDFNGVIIDDEMIQKRAYQEILAGEGVVLTDADYMSSLGMDDDTFVREAYKRSDKTPETNKVLEISEAKTAKWREIVADGAPLFPNIENFIRKCANEFTLGVVSMAKLQEIECILEITDLMRCFDVIISAEEVRLPKPDPQCYREGFRQIDSTRINRGHLPMIHSECLVIEDAPPGIRSAKAADLPVLGVVNTVSEEELRAAGADWVAKDLNDWFPDSLRRAFSRRETA
ncbi:MAG: HAD family hydrolase [Pyrinomonadaceae bacterium]